MNKWIAALLVCACMLLGACALAESYPDSIRFALPSDGPAIMMNLPEGTTMIEHVEFEGGDYIQTFQLPEGVSLQMLRYARMDMTLEELAQGEWPGYASLEKIELEMLSGCPAQGIRIEYNEQGKTTYIVYSVSIQAQNQVLLMQAVFPGSLDEEETKTQFEDMLNSVQVHNVGTITFG